MPQQKKIRPKPITPKAIGELTERWENSLSRQRAIIDRQQGIMKNTRTILNDPKLTDSEKVQLAKEQIQ